VPDHTRGERSGMLWMLRDWSGFHRHRSDYRGAVAEVAGKLDF
jgi:hypothetical protein